MCLQLNSVKYPTTVPHNINEHSHNRAATLAAACLYPAEVHPMLGPTTLHRGEDLGVASIEALDHSLESRPVGFWMRIIFQAPTKSAAICIQ